MKHKNNQRDRMRPGVKRYGEMRLQMEKSTEQNRTMVLRLVFYRLLW